MPIPPERADPLAVRLNNALTRLAALENGTASGGQVGKSAYQSALDTGKIPPGTSEADWIGSIIGAGGLNPRGAWAANTTYAAKDLFTHQGSTYRVLTPFTSGLSFTLNNLELFAAKGADSTVEGPPGQNSTVPGPAGPHPLLVTGLTGGLVGSVGVRSTTDPALLMDVSPADKEELFPTSALYYRASPSEVFSPGGVIPGTFGAGDVGKVVALADKTTAAASNLTLYPRGPVPAALAPSPSRVFLRLGLVESPTSWRFLPAEPVTEAENAVQIFETFSSVANGAPPPTTLVKQLWEPVGETLTVVADAGSTPNWPQDTYLKQLTTNGARRAVALVAPGLFLDGQMGITFAVPAGQDLNNRAVRVYGRASGTNGAQTAIAADLNLGTGRLKLFTYFAGVGSADLAITAGNAITGGAAAPLSVNTLYRLVLWPAGNRVLARVHLLGTSPPPWQVQTFQTTVTTPGSAAFSAATGALDLRVASFAVTTNSGPLKTAP